MAGNLVSIFIVNKLCHIICSGEVHLKEHKKLGQQYKLVID